MISTGFGTTTDPSPLPDSFSKIRWAYADPEKKWVKVNSRMDLWERGIHVGLVADT